MKEFRAGKHIPRKIASLFEMPDDIVYDLPKVNLIGDVQMYIENHRGIIEYGQETIRISVSIGEIEINGEMLCIRNITREEIHLDGVIKSVSYNR